MLDEVHFAAQRSFSYDEISGLKDLEAKLGQDYRHEMRVSVGKERHVGDQPATVIADDFLQTTKQMRRGSVEETQTYAGQGVVWGVKEGRGRQTTACH